MNFLDFEKILEDAVERMNKSAKAGGAGFDSANSFERTVAAELRVACNEARLGTVENTFHPSAFPDILVNGFGVEVKYTQRKTWHGTGNSIFEGMRDEKTKHIYIVFCRADLPEIRWRKYEECIKGVRISHSPRYMIDLDIDESFFDELQIPYSEFIEYSIRQKMMYVREHVKARISEHERLWWIDEENSHTLPMQVRIYRLLPADVKRTLRAEAALMCPQIFKGSRAKGKYDQVAIYLLTQHGVYAPQLRDLFSAGSVAGPERGGNYLLRSLKRIENDIMAASKRLDDALFVEYWGSPCSVEQRIPRWLELADHHAVDFRPSLEFFGGKYSKTLL
ncbi:MAG: restriction endonuclease [Chloroflexota bacterium]|nr:restriction endonuclease [Chloroflexota bacterium]